MPGIARSGTDYATTHSNGGTVHINPKYVGGSGNVLVNGKAAMRKGDSAGCGEVITGASGTVLINGKGVHRKGDSLDAHNTFSPSVCGSASGDVIAG